MNLILLIVILLTASCQTIAQPAAPEMRRENARLEQQGRQPMYSQDRIERQRLTDGFRTRREPVTEMKRVCTTAAPIHCRVIKIEKVR